MINRLPIEKQMHPVLSGGTFAIITAGTPRYRPENLEGHEGLREHIALSGLKHELIGDNNDKFLVHNPTRQQAMELGRKFGQESIIFSQNGKHEFIYTNGPNAGKFHPTKGPSEFHIHPPSKPGFTKLPGIGYVSFQFDPHALLEVPKKVLGAKEGSEIMSDSTKKTEVPLSTFKQMLAKSIKNQIEKHAKTLEDLHKRELSKSDFCPFCGETDLACSCIAPLIKNDLLTEPPIEEPEHDDSVGVEHAEDSDNFGFGSNFNVVGDCASCGGPITDAELDHSRAAGQCDSCFLNAAPIEGLALSEKKRRAWDDKVDGSKIRDFYDTTAEARKVVRQHGIKTKVPSKSSRNYVWPSLIAGKRKKEDDAKKAEGQDSYKPTCKNCKSDKDVKFSSEKGGFHCTNCGKNVGPVKEVKKSACEKCGNDVCKCMEKSLRYATEGEVASRQRQVDSGKLPHAMPKGVMNTRPMPDSEIAAGQRLTEAGAGSGHGIPFVGPKLPKNYLNRQRQQGITTNKMEPLSKPPVSEAQRRAMGAAASGNSTLGIPKKVGKEFIDADKGGKLPSKKSETFIDLKTEGERATSTDEAKKGGPRNKDVGMENDNPAPPTKEVSGNLDEGSGGDINKGKGKGKDPVKKGKKLDKADVPMAKPPTANPTPAKPTTSMNNKRMAGPKSVAAPKLAPKLGETPKPPAPLKSNEMEKAYEVVSDEGAKNSIATSKAEIPGHYKRSYSELPIPGVRKPIGGPVITRPGNVEHYKDPVNPILPIKPVAHDQVGAASIPPASTNGLQLDQQKLAHAHRNRPEAVLGRGVKNPGLMHRSEKEGEFADLNKSLGNCPLCGNAEHIGNCG